MALLVPISIQAVDLYLRRFVLRTNQRNVYECDRFYTPLVSYAELDWTYGDGRRILVMSDDSLIGVLTGEHFELIELNAEGWNHLIVWYPPKRPLIGSFEARVMTRAGVRPETVARISTY